MSVKALEIYDMRNTNVDKLMVYYKDDPIGLLLHTGDGYTFEYLPAFTKLGLSALPGISPPKVHSKDLWAYFYSRIPNFNSPIFKRLIEEHQLDDVEKNDYMTLLATLGSKVATDPFVLKPIEPT